MAYGDVQRACCLSDRKELNDMKFGIIIEHQLPRPWEQGDEHRLFKNNLEQVELADKLGYDSAWLVEHHFLEEYSHSSAPEVFLGAASQRTKNLRLGHGIVSIPPGYNHPARVAERIATLDLLSDGRVEFGTGETSSNMELDGFNVPRETKSEQYLEALDAITRMMVEEPFAGYDGKYVKMPPRNVIPKPLQTPHPPLWMACARRTSIHRAATKGMGALADAFLDPHEAKEWVDDYYETIASEDCVPAGFAVNPNIALAMTFGCHQDEETAINRSLDGAHFFFYSVLHYYGIGDHIPAKSDIWAEFMANRASNGLDFKTAAQQGEQLSVNFSGHGEGSALRGAIGTPAQLRDLIRQYEEVGVDQLLFVTQAGRNKHEHTCESLELFAKEVMPEFAEGEPKRQAVKSDRLEPAMEAALRRREPARNAPSGYHVPAVKAANTYTDDKAASGR
jgi:alkanesulfonate monooxygenase SsuD/methylene tetrahydromethanopterin reductase-like flavin-dependent oxidoreductase (luciferase family)